MPGLGTPWGTPITIEYSEGAEIGYRWHAKTGAQPMYPFGHGLSYTSFDYADLDGAWLIADDPCTGWRFERGILLPPGALGLGAEPREKKPG